MLLELRHPNIIPIYGVAELRHEARTEFALVLTIALGGSLAEKLRGGRPLPLADMCRYGAGIACELEHLRTQAPPLAHWDWKPSNVLLAATYQVCVCVCVCVRALSPSPSC